MAAKNSPDSVQNQGFFMYMPHFKQIPEAGIFALVS